MSGDDELEGSDDTDFREHFAPVARSIRQAVTSRTIQVYVIAFVGIVILAASIGPAVVGAYAPVQEAFGLCSDPTLEVTPAAETDVDEIPPEFPRLDYEELDPAVQQAFRAALADATNEHPITGTDAIEYRSKLRNGVIVTYRGANYYTVIASLNECVEGSHGLVLPIAGLVVGGGMVVAPELQRRYGRQSKGDGTDE